MQNARDTLRDHHGALFVQQLASPEVYQSSGSSDSSIDGMLEVIERAFSKNVATFYPLAGTSPRQAIRRKRRRLKLNKVSQEHESANLKKSAGELIGYWDSWNAELSALMQHLAKLERTWLLFFFPTLPYRLSLVRVQEEIRLSHLEGGVHA